MERPCTPQGEAYDNFSGAAHALLARSRGAAIAWLSQNVSLRLRWEGAAVGVEDTESPGPVEHSIEYKR